jgi:uncharacterized membrane protein YjjB (DUF3815 family)
MTTSLPQVAWQAALGLVATLGFAIGFNLPRGALSRVGLVGMAGFLVRFGMLTLGHSVAAASFAAAFFMGVVGYYGARTFRYPRVLFTVTGIIPLVPGIPAYQAILEFSHGNLSLGLENLVRASWVIIALAAGLTAARGFTWPERILP